MWSAADRRWRARHALEAEPDPTRRRSMFHSLRLRMALSHGGVILLILVFLGGIGQALLARQLDRSATRDVEVAAAQEVDRLVGVGAPTQPPGPHQPPPPPIRGAPFQPGGPPVGSDPAGPGGVPARGTRIP